MTIAQEHSLTSLSMQPAIKLSQHRNSMPSSFGGNLPPGLGKNYE